MFLDHGFSVCYFYLLSIENKIFVISKGNWIIEKGAKKSFIEGLINEINWLF